MTSLRKRTTAARAAIDAHLESHRRTMVDSGPKDALTDILADLMHWARREGIEFEDSLRPARVHFEAEARPADSQPQAGDEVAADSDLVWTRAADLKECDLIDLYGDTFGDPQRDPAEGFEFQMCVVEEVRPQAEGMVMVYTDGRNFRCPADHLFKTNVD